ncbi:MAG: hypothetical protein PHF29_05380 [Candidatus Riflebacteria bacterium]|nr:hypothetical protein [Candidatus Riflebacteria bacterium]
MSKIVKNTRLGMAIPLVLALAGALGLLATYTIKSTQNHNKSNLTSYAQLQAHFIARAGTEHALLKTRFMHRELYDAICLSQGRNPLFDYSAVKTEGGVVTQATLEAAVSKYNPGPVFLYTIGEFTNSGLLTTGFNNPNKDLWLDAFMSDITSESDSGFNDVLSFSKTNSFNDSILGRMSEPFDVASYTIKSLEIAAQTVAESETTATAIENSAVVELTINANVKTARGTSWDYDIKKTVRINRQ